MTKGPQAITRKQQRFVDEYLLDLNATQAAIRAGYSEKSANINGPRLLVNACIQDAIMAAQDKRAARVQIDADYVLRRLADIDQMDCMDIIGDSGAIKPISQWPKIWRQFVSGFDVADIFEGSGDDRKLVGLLKKIKWPDKVKNLELIGRHVGVQAWKDKVEHSGSIQTLSDEELDRKLSLALSAAAESATTGIEVDNAGGATD